MESEADNQIGAFVVRPNRAGLRVAISELEEVGGGLLLFREKELKRAGALSHAIQLEKLNSTE